MQTTYDSHGHRVAVILGTTDRNRVLPRPNARGMREAGRGEPGLVHFDHRDVREGVRSHDLGRHLLSVTKSDLHCLCWDAILIHHMVAGDYVAVGRVDHSGTDALVGLVAKEATGGNACDADIHNAWADIRGHGFRGADCARKGHRGQ